MLSRKREKGKTRYTSLATDDNDEPAEVDADLEHGLDIEAEELSDLESSERLRELAEGETVLNGAGK